MNENITYLKPIAFRRGSPSIIAVVESTMSRKNLHWLRIYENRNEEPPAQGFFNGTGDEYKSRFDTAISKELYDALIKESKSNHKKMEG
jgi:hypothetical protein